MGTHNNDRLTKIFFQACDLDGQERAEFLASACAGDSELLEKIKQMIAEGDDASRHVETHIVDKVVKSAAQLYVDQHEAPPEKIGRYKILRMIGEGGMSVVYEAEQHEPVKRKVALKVIRPGMDTRDVINRFESERQALAVMDHANIAKIFGGGTTDAGRPYFVMELVIGEPITDYCDQHRYTIPQRLKLFNDVCAAVQHAHQKGVVHRDLKPSNILIFEQDKEPLVKVIDFGIAKALDATLNDDPTETRYGQVIGTPSHMSPEQATGNVQDIDTRTDVYSLGVVLFQLLVGVLPYQISNSTGTSIRESIDHSASTRPSHKLKQAADEADEIARDRRIETPRLVRLIARDLDWIVVKAMEIERERRYQTVNALSVDINNFLMDRPIEARPPSTTYVLGRFVRRNRKTVIAATITVMALVSGITMATLGLVKATQAEQEARLDQRTTEKTRDFLISTFKVADSATSLGQKITASDLLKRGAARIEVELSGEPRVQGELLQTMGRAFENLALYDEAEPMLRQSVERRMEAYGENHPKVAEGYQELGEILWRIGQNEESRAAFDKAIDIYARHFGLVHETIAVNKSKLGLVYLNSGDYPKAEALFSESQEIYNQLGDQLTNNYADNLNDLGGVKLRQGNTAMALEYFQQALVIWKRNHGELHPDIALVMANIGSVLASSGEYSQAEEFYQKALQMRRLIYQDDEHSEIAVSLNNLAMLYRRQGEVDKAEPLYRESLQVRRVLQGDQHPSVAITQTNLAATLIEMGRFDEALSEIDKALTVLQAALETDHWRVANALSVKGRALAGNEHYAEAEPLLLNAFEVIRTSRGDRDGHTQRALDRVVQLYALWGKTDDAKDFQQLRSELFPD